MHAKILIAVDGSAVARAACDLGVKIAQSEGAAVVLLHAQPRVAPRLLEEDSDTPTGLERVLAADPALQAAAELARSRGIPFSIELVEAHGPSGVAEAIVGVADALDATMIVIGSRGRGAVAGTILGSVSRAVLRIADGPVVVVHAGPGETS